MFGFTVWLVIGGIVGWIASVIATTDQQQRILANIIVGVSGAYIGGALLAPVAQAASPVSHIIAFGCAIFAVGVFALIRRSKQR